MKKLSKKSTYIALAISALAIIATVVFLIIYDKKKNAGSGDASGSGGNSGSGSGSNSGSNSGSSATTPTASIFPLKKGSRGDEVRKLQAKMNNWVSYYMLTGIKPPYQRLSEDGVFGPKTEANLNFILKKKSITESAYRSFIAMSFGPVDAGGDFWTGSQYSFLKYM